MYQTDAPLSIKSHLALKSIEELSPGCFYVPDPDNAPSRMFTKDPEIGVGSGR